MSCLSQLDWLFKNLSVKIPNAFWSEVVHECFLPEPLSPAPSPALCSPPSEALASPFPAAGHAGLEVPELPGTHGHRGRHDPGKGSISHDLQCLSS